MGIEYFSPGLVGFDEAGEPMWSAFESLAGAAEGVSGVAAIAGAVLFAVTTAVQAGLETFSDQVLPVALASTIKQAQGHTFQAEDLASTRDGVTALTEVLTLELSPTPQADPGRMLWTDAGGTRLSTGNCDNSLIPARAYSSPQDTITVPVPGYPGTNETVPVVPCLNPTAIPQPRQDDPFFVIRQAGQGPGTSSPTIDYQDKAADYHATARISGHWFVLHGDSAGFDGDSQTLRLTYTDWDGHEQLVTLAGDDQQGYHFVGARLDGNGPPDPSTCQDNGTCWSGPSIKYLGADGNQYTATVSVYAPPAGQPRTTTANPQSGSPVAFDNGLFRPGNALGMVSYTWRFQDDSCGGPCVTQGGDGPAKPVYDDGDDPDMDMSPTPTHIWNTTGTYTVEVTAKDADGRTATTTFTVTVGEKPPTLTVLSCSPGQQLGTCNRWNAPTGDTKVSIPVARITHQGSLDSQSVVISWGDGSSDAVQQRPLVHSANAALVRADDHTLELVATHGYAQPGQYFGWVTTTDQAGATDREQLIMRVHGPQTITFPAIGTQHYGQRVLLQATGGGSSNPVTYHATPASVCTLDGDNDGRLSMVGLGTCQVTADQEGDGDLFGRAVSVSQSFQVTPARLSISVDAHTKTYGDPNPDFSLHIDGLAPWDQRSDLTGLTVTGPPADQGVGSYPLIASGVSNPHYSVQYRQGQLQVRPAPLTITPDDQTRRYGSPAPTYTAHYDGLVNGDTQADLTGLVINGAPTSPRVGSYTINAHGAHNSDYDISYRTGTETITPAPLTVTASDVTHPYGSSPSYTVTYQGLVNGDKGIAGLAIHGVPVGTPVGTYPIKPSASDPDYTITYVPGTETITPAPLTIRAVDQTRTYGSRSPSYTASYTGLRNGDTPAVVSGLKLQGPPATSGVGTYPIVPSGATAANYAISYLNGTETVTKAPLTITADDKSKVYGAKDPSYTATYQGLVNGDTKSVVTGLTFSTPPRASHVGSYPITPLGATSPNYAISFVPGTEKITPHALTITAADTTTAYGTLPLYTWKGKGWVNGDSETTPATPPACQATVSGKAVSTTTAPGVYQGAIACSGQIDPDYTITYVNGTLTVDPVVRLDETGLPATVPHQATLDRKKVTLPTGDVEVKYSTSHSFSFPAVVTDPDGVPWMTLAPAFSGPVNDNVSVAASYVTMAGALGSAVTSGALDQSTANSLTAGWSTVQAALKAGSKAKARAAAQSFASSVRGQAGTKIQQATADALVTYAQLVYTDAGGSGTV
jgi:hypothetical protein